MHLICAQAGGLAPDGRKIETGDLAGRVAPAARGVRVPLSIAAGTST